MWTKGLDPWCIAVLCRVPYRKVYDHIRTRIAYTPELFGQRLMVHDQPALPPGYREGEGSLCSFCSMSAGGTGQATSRIPGRLT